MKMLVRKENAEAMLYAFWTVLTHHERVDDADKVVIKRLFRLFPGLKKDFGPVWEHVTRV